MTNVSEERRYPSGQVSRLPSHNGDGYSYGGDLIVTFGGLSISMGSGGGRDTYDLACLIAAAPDMLAALKETLAFAEALEKQSSKGTGGRRGGHIFAKAHAAIAKAEGRS